MGEYPVVQKYCLMSVRGAWTDFHVDFGEGSGEPSGASEASSRSERSERIGGGEGR